MNSSKLNFIDLFCGCGGLSYGLMLAGHECLLGVDQDSNALKTFKLNHPSSEIFEGDIRKLSEKKIKSIIGNQRIDMVVGGPPCQGFSTVGKGHVHDVRNHLFKEFVRVVKITNPRVVVFENVTGLVATKNEKILHRIFKMFEDIGFSMSAQVMSAEEFGVPEKRRRMIIMGVKKGHFQFPDPKVYSQSTEAFKTVREAFKNLKAENGKIYNHEIQSAQVSKKIDQERLKFIPAGKGIRYESDEKNYLPKKLHFGINWKQLREGRFRQTRYQRLPWDAPSPTILTSRTSYYHPKENRYLTAREAARCQSFPNDFIFAGSLTSIFRQIGNAVPPMLARALGLEIKKIKWEKNLVNKRLLDTTKLKRSFHYHENKNVA